MGWRHKLSRRFIHRVFLCSKPTAWDGDISINCSQLIKSFVLSPLGGMETKFFPLVRVSKYSFKPTGWDGDCYFINGIKLHAIRSEPTVWDGDSSCSFFNFSQRLCVLSPLSGMATGISTLVRSAGSLFVPSPPCGIATGTLIFLHLWNSPICS